ncbi:hypothetical protein [Amycolatopsis sp. GA6-003]|uniref:hypothetical protein n=1 Tax=Amycolatopsis sp. GA6-003 TaxID=2652444 RepID=UPI003916DC08
MNHPLLDCELTGLAGSATSGSIHAWMQLLVMAILLVWCRCRCAWPDLPGYSTKEVYIVNITISSEGGTDDPRVH